MSVHVMSVSLVWMGGEPLGLEKLNSAERR